VQAGAGVQVRFRSNYALQPRVLKLTNPARLVLNFQGAQWADGVTPPAAMAGVKQVRLGHPFPNVASLVLDMEAGFVKLTSVNLGADGTPLRPGSYLPPRLTMTPSQRDAHIKAIIKRTGGAQVAKNLPSRGGQVAVPGVIDPLNPSQLPELPQQNPGERFNPIPSIRGAADSLVGRLICVDAGHGGHSSGAKGLNYLEKDLCLKMALELRQSLVARGATVIMPRESDVFVSLDGRCEFANSRGAEIFISIHCNSMPRRNMQSGSETYWRTPQSLALAQKLHPRIVAAVRGRDGGIRNRSFAVIRETTMPSVLLEIAYINNTQDEQLLADGQFHGGLAEQLAEGVVDYFRSR
jgi:N-acetylmuramoyl-L-alanine amidase